MRRIVPGPLIAALLAFASYAAAADYFVAPIETSGSGTIGDPWGLPDLPRTTGSGVAPGPAIGALGPGDTLWFRAGTYRLPGAARSAAFDHPLIAPARSGTPSDPITIAAAPGETVELVSLSPYSPILGVRDADHIRLEGFTVRAESTIVGIRLVRSKGARVSNCRVIGGYLPTGDNHDGIRLDSCVNALISRCEVVGWQGDGLNSAAVKIYWSRSSTLRDCLFRDSVVGVFDKWANTATRVERCVIRTTRQPISSNASSIPASLFVVDCDIADAPIVVDGPSEVRIRGNVLYGRGIALFSQRYAGKIEIRDNVLVSRDPTIRPVEVRSRSFATAGLTEMDRNIYRSSVGVPSLVYPFGQYTSAGVSKLTPSDLIAAGFETLSVASPISGDAAPSVIASAKYGPESRRKRAPPVQEPVTTHVQARP